VYRRRLRRADPDERIERGRQVITNKGGTHGIRRPQRAVTAADARDTAPVAAPAATPEKKSGSWDWLWPSIVAVIIVKLFGLVGGLVTFGCYYWLKPKLGTWGAVAVSGVIGVVVAIGLVLAMIR
jgi:hypothetical protein